LAFFHPGGHNWSGRMEDEDGMALDPSASGSASDLKEWRKMSRSESVLAAGLATSATVHPAQGDYSSMILRPQKIRPQFVLGNHEVPVEKPTATEAQGRYTFIWEHPADEVLVTGTFDDWQMTVRLEKHEGIFKKQVLLPRVPTHYRFLVDGNLVVNESKRLQDVGSGILDNAIFPEDMIEFLEDAAGGDNLMEMTDFVPEREPYIDRKLDRILATISNESACHAFKSHGISDLWLPISKQTLPKILPDAQERRAFLTPQNTSLDTEIAFYNESSYNRVHTISHTAIEDDEDLVVEHRALGEGAYGSVDEVSIVIGTSLTRCVRKRLGRPGPLKAQKAVMAAFAREINVMRQVVHQHCVRLLGSYTDIDHVNILSSPVADMDLATLLDRPIDDEKRVVIYRGIGCLCNALNYLHQNKIRHEDLKPQNILIHGDNILLTDFGFSLDFSDDCVSTTTGRPSAWTIRYSAPEVLNFEPRNRASDIYSLGCVLIEMMSGYYGTSLTDLKKHWKESGNGQSSFARNPEATVAWLGTLEGQRATPLDAKLDVLCRYLRTMLAVDRTHRPTAQQVIDHLSDLSVLFPTSSPSDFASCRGPVPCIGLCNTRDPVSTIPSNIIVKLEHMPYLANFLYHHIYTSGGAWSIWYLNLRLVNDAHNQGPVSPIYANMKTIAPICEYICARACKTGSTKHFWDASRVYSNKEPSVERNAQMGISAKLLSLRHIVFTRVTLSFNTDQGLKLCHAQITLVPNCLPRSVHHGSFFWLISYHLPAPADPKHYDPEESFTDLTILE
jgi:serine/threonine protein kinase